LLQIEELTYEKQVPEIPQSLYLSSEKIFNPTLEAPPLKTKSFME